MIEQRIGFHRRSHTYRQRNAPVQHQRHRCQQERVPDVLIQQRADRDLVLQRKTEVALQQLAEPVPIADEQRLVQPIQRPQFGGALRRQVDVAVDKVAGGQREDKEDQQ
ncbi:hypothetical protein D3C80_1939140 [compost metagenome]